MPDPYIVRPPTTKNDLAHAWRLRQRPCTKHYTYLSSLIQCTQGNAYWAGRVNPLQMPMVERTHLSALISRPILLLLPMSSSEIIPGLLSTGQGELR